MRVGLIGAPAGFETEVAAATGVARAPGLERGLDLIQGFFTRRAHLARDIPRLQSYLGPRGILWVCYPKAKALGTDLDRDTVRETAARVGLKAVAIVAVDDIWSALRLRRSS
jgi:hypothetical protein